MKPLCIGLKAKCCRLLNFACAAWPHCLASLPLTCGCWQLEGCVCKQLRRMVLLETNLPQNKTHIFRSLHNCLKTCCLPTHGVGSAIFKEKKIPKHEGLWEKCLAQTVNCDNPTSGQHFRKWTRILSGWSPSQDACCCLTESELKVAKL